MPIPNPNPNIADGIKCDNKTYSSNKIESLISTTLPTPEAGDAGKVLAVDDELGYELAAPIDPTVLIDDTAAALTTTYSSDKIDDLIEPFTKNTATVTVHSDVTSGDLADASVTRIGDVVIVSFEANIKAGTYTNLYNVSPVPSAKQLAVVDISGTSKLISVSTAGVIAFTEATTLAADGVIKGQLVYIV